MTSNKIFHRSLASALVLALLAIPHTPAHADATPAQVDAVIDEGLNRSQAMANASALMDGIGPRLTNSENFRKAADWAVAKFREFGLSNVHREPYRFGVGWNLDSHSARMVSPRTVVMREIPVAWSPPTDGVLRGAVVVAPMSKPENLAAWKGKLAGRIVLVSLPGASSESKDALFQRFEEKDIAALDHYDLPDFDPDAKERGIERAKFLKQLAAFCKAEGALAMVKMAYRDGGLVSGEGYAFQPGDTLPLPYFELAQEDYRRLVRLARTGPAPVVELQAAARYDTANLDAEDLIAEIPGRDPKAGFVMAGAHFDSWIAADGATDNGAGSIVVLEAARILARLGVRPKRTIRFALWSGEEQGLLGSLAYVEKHLASRPLDPSVTGEDKYFLWPKAFPITPQAEYGALKAYFNLDNGAGKVRGIYAEDNVAAVPTLEKWLAPFKAMGAGSVVASRTDGTDHVFLQSVGLPGFEFIQDPLDYETRVHHSTLDTVDHMRGDDLRQAATIMAAMLLQAADSDAVLPRPPLPTRPVATDPFKVQDPNE